MENLIHKVILNQSKFFAYFFSVVIILIAWSYFEGVGDIYGEIHIGSKPGAGMKFKAGYFTSLNYGIYYLFVMPLFFKAVFAIYSGAFRISELDPNTNITSPGRPAKVKVEINKAVEHYSSKIISFLRWKYSLHLFLFLNVLMIIQSIYVTNNNQTSIALGWTQGLNLQKQLNTEYIKQRKATKAFPASRQLITNNTLQLHTNGFYFKKGPDLTSPIDTSIHDIKITNLSFSCLNLDANNLYQLRSNFEFNAFVYTAKTFFSLFEGFVFFFNINMLVCLIKFIREKNKELLFQSEPFVKSIEDLITKISLSGLLLTIYLYFRYIANIQKGSFKPFEFKLSSILYSDQYTIMLGMIFIPFTSIALFIYLYFSDTVIDIKASSFKSIIALYFPVFFFLAIFFIYLMAFDPYLASQFGFIIKPLEYINKYLLA